MRASGTVPADYEASLTVYVLCPGYVRSANDGDRHFINADQLACLYHVKRSDCTVMPEDSRGWQPPNDAYYLRPRYDGRYALPERA